MKKFLQNEEFQLDEILFENRNKNYGAYALRNESDQILTKSMFIGIGVFAMIALTPLMINVFNSSDAPVIIEESGPFIMDDVEQVERPPAVVPVTPPIQVPVNTLDSRVPTPTKNPPVQHVMPTQTEYDGAVIGTQDIVGVPPVTFAPPQIIIDAPVKGPEIIAPKPIDNSPKVTVDVQANFTGGINSFRTKVVNQFDTSVMDGTNNVVKTTIIFIVEKDGSISEVKATGANSDFNREAIKTIKAVKGKWVPAKLNGENVRSYFKFPISMQFE